jgi:hypothetical protein
MLAIDSRKSREIVPASDGDRLALNAFFPRWLAQGTGYSAWLAVDRSAEPEVVGAAILQNTLDGEGEEAGLFMDIAAIDESIFLDVVEGLLKEVLDAARAWGAPAVNISSSANGAHAVDMLLKRGFVVTDTFDTYEVDLEPAMGHLQKVISKLKGRVRSRAEWTICPALAEHAEAIGRSWNAWIGGSSERKYQQLRARLDHEASNESETTTAILAIENDMLVGFIIASLIDDDVLVVHGQAIAPALRVDLLHTELLECVLTRAHARGATRIRFEAGRSQPNTLRVAARNEADVLSSSPSLRLALESR